MNDLDLNPTDSGKLLLTLQDKKNYVVHYRNLQFDLKQGMKLKHVHIVLEFDQEKWMYTGMTIFDNSKIQMYDFFYNHLNKQYGPKCELLYTDTDSLILEIETENVYKDMEANKNLYDTSDYPKENPLYSVKNKKVLGKMKDECARTPIAECACLRPKRYSIVKAGRKKHKESKRRKKERCK